MKKMLLTVSYGFQNFQKVRHLRRILDTEIYLYISISQTIFYKIVEYNLIW